MKIKNIVTFGYAEKEKIAKRELEQAQDAWEKWKFAAINYDENKKVFGSDDSAHLSNF